MNAPKDMPPVPEGVLTQEQVEAISGGFECTPEQVGAILGALKDSYEQLIDFTTYVIERVTGP